MAAREDTEGVPCLIPEQSSKLQVKEALRFQGEEDDGLCELTGSFLEEDKDGKSNEKETC